MALALYRKYRPRTFAEVIGQEHVTVPLIQALRSGRLNHAYLFSGPRGCGKTSSARILARSLNCVKGPTPDPCGDCESCRALAPDGPGSIDVIEIDAASHGGVDDARELRERAFFAPAISRFKIYIIDEAHMVSPAGFNALLKLVEEPPDYVKFVFATTEPEKVLATIKSRTHHYPFRLMPPGVLRPYLEQLCESEGATVDPKVLPLVVRAGAGSARDSLSVLDQLIAGAGPEGVTYAQAVALLGVTDAGIIDDVCDALAASDPAAAFAAVERVVEAGHDPRRFTGDLLERLRDLILLRQVPDAASKGLIDAPTDQLERMQAQAGRVGPAALSRWAEILHNGLIEMRGTASTRLLLELLIARMLLPTVDSSDAGLLARLERLEQGVPAVPAAQAAPAADAAPVAEAAPAARRGSTRAAAQADGEPDDETPPWAEADEAPVSAPPTSRRASAPARSRSAAEEPASAPGSAVGPTGSGADLSGSGLGGGADASGRAEGSDPGAGTEHAGGPAGDGLEGGGVDAASVRRAWDEIVQLTGRSNKRIAAMARDGVVRDVEGSTIVLVFKASFHANSVSSDPGSLLEAVHQVMGGTWQLRCEVGGEQRGGSPGRSAGGGRSSAGKAEGSPPIRSASPAPTPTSSAPAAQPAQPMAQVSEEWPETAPIGGTATDPADPAPSEPSPPPRAVTPADVRAEPQPTAKPTEKSTARPTSKPQQPARAAAADDDFGPMDEPPYDPEFDGHIADPGTSRVFGNGRGSGAGAPAKPAAVVATEEPPRTGRAAAAQIAARAAGRSGQRASTPRTATATRPAPQQASAPAAAQSEPALGFDPGDEPTDEVLDAGSARQSVEQQAVESLRERFSHVEKIADL